MDLNLFLKNHSNKKIVLVQGLGFVGSVMSLVVSNAINGDYAVIGVDQDTEAGRKTVDSLNNGSITLQFQIPGQTKNS